MRAPASPQLRFLLRGSALLLLMLALWWWVLLTPLLGGMRLASDLTLRLMAGQSASGGVTVNPTGGWILQVPVPGYLAKLDSVQRAFGHVPGGPPVKVRSFKLAVAERIPTFFTLTFPLFWALILAAPRTRQLWRVAAVGTGLLALLAMLSMLTYTAYSIQTTLRLAVSPLATTLWGVVEYFNINLISYTAPFLIALWLHAELRMQILAGEVAVAADAPTNVEEKPRRTRRRR